MYQRYRIMFIPLMIVLIAGLMACSAKSPSEVLSPAPTVDVKPTVDIEATVEARVAFELALRPTATMSPSPSPKPTLSTTQPTIIPTSEPTPVPTPVHTPMPTSTPSPTATPMSTSTPSPTATPLPPSKFEGGFVMMLDSGLGSSVITFKINGIPTRETFTNWYLGKMVLMDLHSDSSNTTMRDTTLSGRSNRMPPGVVAGRAYIDGAHAPDGSAVTAWVGGEEIIESRTTVNNNPQPVSLPKLIERLGRSVRPENPCTVQYKCEGRRSYNVGGGKVSDYIDLLFTGDHSGSREPIWQFYSTDPAWRLANNVTQDNCNDIECRFTWIHVNRVLRLYPENELSWSAGEAMVSELTAVDGNGWNMLNFFGWPVCFDSYGRKIACSP